MVSFFEGDSSKSAICPGQAGLLPNEGGKHYLRVAFTAYWQDSAPSTEIFYLTEYPMKLSIAGIEVLENDILTLLKNTDSNASPLRVLYLGYSGVEVTDTEAEALGWRVVNYSLS